MFNNPMAPPKSYTKYNCRSEIHNVDTLVMIADEKPTEYKAAVSYAKEYYEQYQSYCWEPNEHFCYHLYVRLAHKPNELYQSFLVDMSQYDGVKVSRVLPETDITTWDGLKKMINNFNGEIKRARDIYKSDPVVGYNLICGMEAGLHPIIFSMERDVESLRNKQKELKQIMEKHNQKICSKYNTNQINAFLESVCIEIEKNEEVREHLRPMLEKFIQACEKKEIDK